ncbi:MAG: hypothetical protein E7290_08105 [Lachnospiraceae bacterium]|nr:hypothetical protein [Lachnospiraceae bacterium]
MSRRYRKNDADGMGCIVILLIAVFAMPLVGIYLALAGEESEQRVLGVALTIVGILVWIGLGIGA